MGNTVETVRDMPRPRFTRSHLPWDLLPKDLEESKAKVNITLPSSEYPYKCMCKLSFQIIYTSRNPKDLCVSFYHYCKLMHGLQGTFEDFLQLFIDELTPIGSYWKHVLPFWKRSNDANILFLKYEDMKRDLPATIRKCAEFLHIDYDLTEENMKRICEHLQFDKMQANPAVNLDPILNCSDSNGNTSVEKRCDVTTKFIRKGQIGDWKNYIPDEMSERFDIWIDQNLKDSGLTFEYD